VFVENYKAGTLARYGLDYASLREINPRIVYCSVTGFGEDGPYGGLPAYDFILQGMSGLMSTCGSPDDAPGGAPMRTAVPITDIVTGLYAAISILAALRQRDESGRGQFIDAAMIDASVALNGHLALGYLMTGQVPRRIGNANPIAAPSETYAASDGRIIVAAGNNGQFAALAKAVGLPNLLDDPLFATNVVRVRNRAALSAQLAARFETDTARNWLDKLGAAGVPCGPINNMAAVFDDPHVRHRGLQMRVPHGRGVEAPVLKSPLNLSEAPVDYRASPMLGADTEAVLRDRLGMNASQIARLRDANTI
jgi:crotonobetainyl-CoA:carnitine CoA-transferase CaiB-like acyl-CoA transferase